MNDKKLTEKQQLFIRQMVLHGNRAEAYQNAYPGAKRSSAYSRACALMKNPVVQKYYNREMEKLAANTIRYHVAALKEKLDTYAGMRDILADIINGDLKSEKSYKVENDVKTVELKASVSEVLKALNTNLKLFKSIENKGFQGPLKIFIGDEEFT